MGIEFQPLGEQHALEILSWRYAPPYDVYDFDSRNFDADLGCLIDSENRFFAIAHQQKALAGFCSFSADGKVPGGDYSRPCLDIGMGIRPDLTGRGNGKRYAQAVVSYGVTQYEAKRLRVTIAAFNQRAQRVWQSLGFEVIEKFLKPDSDMAFVMMVRETGR